MKKPGEADRSDAFEKTREYLGRLLGYLEGLYTSMDWEAEAASGQGPEAPGSQGLPFRLARILADNGYLQGLSLKSQGCLSSELLEFIRDIGFAFEVEAAPQSMFKLPFIDNELIIRRKTLNVFMEKAWLVYHAALLSAYALKPLRFEKIPGPGGDMEETVRILEARTGEEAGAAGLWPEGPAPETLHAANNGLAGITSYVSLVLAERKGDADLQQKLGLVLEAARKAGEALKRK
jgi:hypothetical protein